MLHSPKQSGIVFHTPFSLYQCRLKILKGVEDAFANYEEKCTIFNEIVRANIASKRARKRLFSKISDSDIISDKIFRLEVWI